MEGEQNPENNAIPPAAGGETQEGVQIATVNSTSNENMFQQQLPSNIYIRQPKDLMCCQLASPIQFFTLFLIVYNYAYLLVIEDNTFARKGALSTYGLKLHVNSQNRCKRATQGIWPIKDSDGNVHMETRWIYYPLCEVSHIEPSYIFFWNTFVIGMATFVNFFYYKGKCVKSTAEATVYVFGLIFYVLASMALLYYLIKTYFEVCGQLPKDMFEELESECRYLDDISSLWATTQATSQCCGGINGPSDWNICDQPGQYHRSCLDTKRYKYQESTALNYPNVDQVWKEGCVYNELKKMRRYSTFLIALILVQVICCTVIVGSFAYAPLGSILPINATYTVIGGKPKRKVFVTMRGDRERFSFSQTSSGRFVIRVKNIKTQETIREDREIQEYFLRKFLHSKYSVNVCEGNNVLILQVEITGHSSLIQTIHSERRTEDGFQYLEITNF